MKRDALHKKIDLFTEQLNMFMKRHVEHYGCCGPCENESLTIPLVAKSAIARYFDHWYAWNREIKLSEHSKTALDLSKHTLRQIIGCGFFRNRAEAKQSYARYLASKSAEVSCG